MDLAISTAIVEGVDLLARTKDFRSHLPVSHICRKLPPAAAY